MGRQYKSTNYFSPFDSNTIDDRTNAKMKISASMKEWNGLLVGASTFSVRHPQDLPVIPQKQHVFKEARSEQVEAEGPVDGIEDEII